MDRRIIALIVFLLAGFLAAEGSAFAVKEGGIKKVLSNYNHGKYFTVVNQIEEYPQEALRSDGVAIDDIIITMADPPIPLPPPPPPPLTIVK